MVPEGCQDFFEKVPARFQKGFSRTPGVLDSSQEYQQQVPRRRASSLSVRPASPLPERTQHIKQSQKALKRSKKKKKRKQYAPKRNATRVSQRAVKMVPGGSSQSFKKVLARFRQIPTWFQHASAKVPR
jgi:hypothetical protein